MKVEIRAEVIRPWRGLVSHRVERSEHSVREALLSKHGISGAQAAAATRQIETPAASERLSPLPSAGQRRRRHRTGLRVARPRLRAGQEPRSLGHDPSVRTSARPSPSSLWTTCSGSPTSWSLARAVAFSDTPANGPVQAAERGTGKPAMRISRADFAGFLIDTVERETGIR